MVVADQPVVLFQFFGAVVIVWALLLAFFVGYKRQLQRQLRLAAEAEPRRLGPSWQAGRWDTDKRHAYVANVGDEAAYDVSVTEGERVVAAAPIVPAYGADQLASTSSLPCYLNFCIHADAKRLTAVNANRETHSLNTADHSQRPVDVIVTWRSDDGEWSTQQVPTD